MTVLIKRRVTSKNTKILTIILFLYCINFLSVGSYIPFLLLPVLLVYILKERFNASFLVAGFLLLLFFISYSFFLFNYGYSSTISIIGKLVYPISFYFLGYWLVKKDVDYNKTIRYLFAIIIAFTLYGVLSTQKALSFYGGAELLRTSIGRVGIDIWSNEVVSATALNAWLSFGLCLLPLLFIKDYSTKYTKEIKIISLFCFIASFYGVIQLGNRTGIVIIVLTFIITLLSVTKLSIKKILNGAVLVLFLSLLAFLYNMNVFGIKFSVETSYLFNRFTDSSLGEDPRIASWKAAFWGIFEYPMGGRQTLMPLNSAHNMWLDVGYESGIIPFVLLVMFTIMSFIVLLKFVRSNHPLLLKGLFVSLYFSFILTFFVEPVLLGLNEYFTIFCLFVGMIYRLNYDDSIKLLKKRY